MDEVWYKYVYRYPEGLTIYSSSITPHLIRLCPDYINHYLADEIVYSLKMLEADAERHITIYRAIEFAAQYNINSSVRQEAAEILKRIKKPTTYQRIVYETVEITEDEPDAST